MRIVRYLQLLTVAIVVLATPDRTRAQDGTLLETLQVPAGYPRGPVVTGTTVLQEGQTYSLVVTGTVTRTFQQFGTRFDALYCYEELIDGAPVPSTACGPPQARQLLLVLSLGGVERGLEGVDDPPGMPVWPPYDPSHRYEATFTAWATGPLVAQEGGSNVPNFSGGYTVELYAAAACPAPESGAIRPLACAGPTITSLIIPPAIWADKKVPVHVGYSSPDSPVRSVRLRRKSPSTGRGVREFDRENDFPVDFPRGRGTIAVNDAVTCTVSTATKPNGEEAPELNEWWNTHQVRATIRDAAGFRSGVHNATYTCIRKPAGDQIIANLTALLALGATVAAIATLAPELALWVKLTTGFTGAGATVLAVIQAIRLDPPDPNFETLPVPATPFVPSVAADDEVTPEMAAAANALADRFAEVAGLQMAFLQAMERAQGAADADDPGWYTQQTTAAIQLASQWAAALEDLPTLSSGVSSAWRAAGLPDVAVFAEDVLAFQDELVFFGLPPAVTDVLDQLGDDGRLYDLLLDLLLAVSPEAIAGSVVARHEDPALAAAVATTVQDLRRMAGNGRQCEPTLCDDANACTVESCNADGCDYATAPGCSETICATSAECDDGDPCTDDACAGNCSFTAVTGAPRLVCAFEHSLTPAACQGAKIPGAIAKKFAAAARSADKLAFDPLTAKQRLRAAKKANGALKKALAVLGRAESRKKNALPAPCAAALRAVLTSAQAPLSTPS